MYDVAKESIILLDPQKTRFSTIKQKSTELVQFLGNWIHWLSFQEDTMAICAASSKSEPKRSTGQLWEDSNPECPRVK